MERTVSIIVNWNNHEDTIKSIVSLNRSSSSTRIIVVDNASQESSYEELQKIKGIVLIRNDVNLGFGRGNNVGIRWALENTNCEFVFLLNNDATVKSDTLIYLESAMDSSQEIGVSAPRIVLSDNPLVLWYGGGYFWWPKGAPRTPGYLGPAESQLARTGRDVSFASGCAMMIRRNVLERIGGFDPRYFMYEEDAEICLRIIKSGWKIRYVPDALVEHDCHGSQRRKGIPLIHYLDPINENLCFNIYHTIRNRLLTAKIHASGMNMLKFVAVFPLYLCLICFNFALYRRFDAILVVLKGIRDFVTSIDVPASK